jgi:hypothetical protein
MDGFPQLVNLGVEAAPLALLPRIDAGDDQELVPQLDVERRDAIRLPTTEGTERPGCVGPADGLRINVLTILG